MTKEIIFKEHPTKTGKIGLITLNRPNALNALNKAMCIAIHDHLKAWASDDALHAVIIESNSERAFCAGGDIRVVYDNGPDNAKDSLDYFHREYQMNADLHHFPKPYIALLDGITMGGGLGVSVHGSHRVASENLLFAMPETSIGFFPDVGTSYVLPRCPYKLGFYLGLTGNHIKVEDAYYVGLVNHAVPSGKFPDLREALLNTDLSDDAFDAVTNIINQFAIEPNPAPLAEHQATIENCFSKNTVEEIIEALKKENTDWANNTVKTLLKRSPTSLKVVLHELQQGTQKEFDDCIAMELTLGSNFLKSHDLYEGIRAAIIDKDRMPAWKPDTLKDIDITLTEKYFKGPQEGLL